MNHPIHDQHVKAHNVSVRQSTANTAKSQEKATERLNYLRTASVAYHDRQTQYDAAIERSRDYDLDRETDQADKKNRANRPDVTIKRNQGNWASVISANNRIKDRQIASFMLSEELIKVLQMPVEGTTNTSDTSDMIDLGWGFNEDSTTVDINHDPLTDTLRTLETMNVTGCDRHRMTLDSDIDSETLGRMYYSEKAKKAFNNHTKKTTKERKYHGIEDILLNKDGSLKAKAKAKKTQADRKMDRLARIAAKAAAKAKA